MTTVSSLLSSNQQLFLLAIFLVLLFNFIISFPDSSSSTSLPVCKETELKYDFTECDEFGGKWRVKVPNSPGHCTSGLSYVPTRVHSCFTSCEGGQFFNKTTLLCEDCQPGHYSLSGGIVYDNFNNSRLGQLPDGFHIITESKTHNDDDVNKCLNWYVDPLTGNLVSKIDLKPDSSPESGCATAITYTAKVIKRGRLRFTYHYKTPTSTPLSLLFTFNFRLYDGIGVVEDDVNPNIKFPMTTVERNFETIDLQLHTPGLYIFTWKSIVIKNFRNYLGFSSMNNYGKNFFTFDNDAASTINDNTGYQDNGLFQNKISTLGVIRINKIIIEGVAYASECTPCEQGTYAPRPGMKECLFCPPNTAFNGSGAIVCSKCDPITEYAASGSTRCLKRPVCGQNDFYSIPKEPCDPKTLKQEIEFKWIEPRICVDMNQVFPKQNEVVNCTLLNNTIDCDLGMELKMDSTTAREYCQFCPDGYYRDENIQQCQPCPPVTNPFYALWIRHWNNSLPGWSDPNSLSVQDDYFAENPSYLNAYFSRQCFRSDDDLVYASSNGELRSSNENNIFEEKGECISRVAWQPFEYYIRTGSSAPLDAYLVLSLTIPSFRSTNQTELSFTFDLNCELGDQCLFLFVETRPDESDLRLQDFYEKNFNPNQKQIPNSSSNKKKYLSFSQQTINQVIKEWTQSTNGKTVFRHQIERNTSLTFSWIFKRTKSFQSYSKIESLMLTGSNVGSATRCQSCPILSKSLTECISCPHGQYLQIDGDNKTTETMETLELEQVSPYNYQCMSCPKNHILNMSNSLPIGIQSCMPCAENLISDNETNDCYSDCLVSFDQDQYDLRELHQPILYKGINLFTSGGTQYMNLFKISLCGHRKRNDLSTCLNNITVFADDSSGVRSYICRSTIIPDGSRIFSAQSASLGDQLVRISRESSFENISVHKDFINSPEANKFDKDFHLFFKTQSPTSACPQGRKLTITMRCTPGIEMVKTPTTCPDGTCNGCDFHLLIQTGTAAACRFCRPYSDDYETVVGECIEGSQQVHYVNPKTTCIIRPMNDTQNIKFILNRPCSLLLPKQVQIGIALAIALGLLLLLLVFYFWNKNRSLEYKYTKLIENTPEGKGHDDDLTLDNCCVEDEEDLHVEASNNTNYAQLSFNNKNDSHHDAKTTSNHPHRKFNNNRIDKKNENLKQFSQEMQQLFPESNNLGANKHQATIDDEGYETIHLISANKSTDSSDQSNLINPNV